jgi:hypothetical protein
MAQETVYEGVLHGDTPETKMPAEAGILREKGGN